MIGLFPRTPQQQRTAAELAHRWGPDAVLVAGGPGPALRRMWTSLDAVLLFLPVGAAVRLAEDGGVVFTGRLSLAGQPWLGDHVVGGQVFFPGTGFLELAVRAADEVGCNQVRDLTLAAPLVLPAEGAVQVQLRVGAADESGDRELRLHSRPADDRASEWVQHAAGTLAADEHVLDFDTATWPPAGASEVDIDGLYDDYAATGLTYGPVFRGLRAVWSGDGEYFAEVALPQQAAGAEHYGVHPALLDAVLHATVFAVSEGDGRGLLPFSWSGCSLHASGASALRVRISRNGKDSVRLVAADPLAGIAQDAAKYVVTFLSDPPDPALLPDPAQFEPDVVRYGEREIFAWCPDGVRNARAPQSWWERRLGVTATSRNRATVERLLALAQA